MSARDDRTGGDSLDHALRELRSIEAPESLVRKAFANLDAPERPRRAPRRGAWFTALLYLAPVTAVAATAALSFTRVPVTSVAPAAREFSHAREIALELPRGGDAMAELSLATHHHDERNAHVRVEVPEGVALHLDVDARATACAQSSCVHRWQTGSPSHRNPLQIVVSEPGRYVIHVTHESGSARVSERFVVLAHRRPVPAA